MRRSGFTLLEMMVVMFLVVLTASLALPVVDALMHPNQVSAAIDAVRANWEQTRSRAMEEGRPYRFSVVLGGNKFRIEPDDADTNSDAGFVIDGELSEACLFVESAGQLIPAETTISDSDSMTPIAVFLPDGTARENVELSFGRPGLMPATLRLRALTGSVTQAKEASP